jgi:regulator of sirC expression with transglutaminase-like and TPR domain
MLATPGGRIDFARAKIAFDRLVDPSIDVDATSRKIDAMVVAARDLAGPEATDVAKLRAVRRYIYEAGPWNGYRPFRYDLSDPLGLKMTHKTLANYFSTHLGNCVSMPVLFLILANRLGVHVTLSTAPDHLFLKYVDDSRGTVLNIEATSGGNPARDAWIRRQFPMSDRAVANGIYLQTLSKRESLAVMAWIVLDDDMGRKRYRETVRVAQAILRAYPDFAPAMVDEGPAAARLIDSEFRAKYPTPRGIPADRRGGYLALVELNRTSFVKAEALGWRETDGQPTLSLR